MGNRLRRALGGFSFSSDSVVSMPVTMTCMTTKQKFDVENPDVIVLKNGRYAYRTPCPWKGKNDRDLSAFKFCSRAAHEDYLKRTGQVDTEQDSAIAEQK